MNGLEKAAAKFAGIDIEKFEAFKAWEAEQKTEELAEEAAVAEVTETFGEVTLEDGSILYFPGEELTEGAEGLKVGGPEGEDAPDGDHTLENGDVVTIEGGIVIAIATAEEPEAEEEAPADEEELAEVEVEEVEELQEETTETENFEALLALMQEFDARLSALEGTNGELSAENAELKTELATEKAKTEKLSRVTAESHHNRGESTVTTKSFKKMSKIERLAAQGQFKKVNNNRG